MPKKPSIKSRLKSAKGIDKPVQAQHKMRHEKTRILREGLEKSTPRIRTSKPTSFPKMERRVVSRSERRAMRKEFNRRFKEAEKQGRKKEVTMRILRSISKVN